jgi:hypothetical protein
LESVNAIKHNRSYEKDFLEWVDKWNEENSNKFGKMEVVDNIDEADVIATQFRTSVAKYVPTVKAKPRLEGQARIKTITNRF